MERIIEGCTIWRQNGDSLIGGALPRPSVLEAIVSFHAPVPAPIGAADAGEDALLVVAAQKSLVGIARQTAGRLVAIDFNVSAPDCSLDSLVPGLPCGSFVHDRRARSHRVTSACRGRIFRSGWRRICADRVG